MFDTLAIARRLTDVGLPANQVDALADALREAAQHDAARVDVKALATKLDLRDLRAEIYRAMLVQTAVTVGLLGLLLGFLRWLG